MGNSSSFTINIKALFDASEVKNSLGNIQNALNGLKLPANVTKGLQDTFSKLSAEVKNFEVLSGKGVKDSGDFKRVETSVNKIITLYEKLKVEAKDLGGIDISKLFPTSIVDTISKANAALDAYQKKVASASNEVEKANKKLTEWQSRLTARQATRDERSNDLSKAQEQLAKAEDAIQTRTGIRDTAEAWKQIQDMANQAAEAAKKYANVEQSALTSGQKSVITKANNLQQLVDNYRNAGEAVKVAQSALSAANANVTKATNQVRDLTQAVKDAETTAQEAEAGALQTLLTDLGKLNGIDLSNYEASFKGAASAVEDFINKNGSAAKGQVEGIIATLEKEGISVDGLRAKLEEASIESQRFDERMRDIGAFKSRIQYFFGLNNVINLFKRGIRQAVDTIKDLDKAMTETAVVTDFTVSDMWKQLPEYTKRANELGVTTQQAYESATLFYQQGLNTQQAAALSTETLKMARIAGLDAAEATDRMTNALRGFNMELDAQSAQRIDDVYSELAARSASNVDEISTAMTKVASLAHSANMEFETTAAFLAQIIETTRESAETAGTALKTVIARFSEVKKLYGEDQLKGTDEEGQTIDVNKISTALRTAGIDLNKYFLGEVGLDDIFMELASKWDTLNSVQQRYIATQAAGSRQQSRFIALMQDYARTQELVGMAYDANGASAKQFEKTQESLQSKLARLKNAWDEFLMGLTNNVVVKTAVDLLTNLLNLVNKITSAFGDGAGSILKWVVALAGISTLKGMFGSGRFVDRLLMTVLEGTGLGKAGIKSGVLSGLMLGGGISSDQTNQVQLPGQRERGPTIIGNIGKGLWSGAKNLGTKMWGAGNGAAAGVWGAGANLHGAAGLAAGLSGIATALGAITAAVGVAYGAYQLWLNLTPEGKLKKATKQAENFKKQAEESENELKSLTSLEDTYKEKTIEVDKATNAQDRAAAIKERNQAVLDAIEQDGTLAKYVVTEVVDNEIQITINEDALANAITKASNEVEKATRQAEFGNALVSLREADKYEQQLKALEQRVNRGVGGYVAPTDQSVEGYLNSVLNSNIATESDKTNAAKLYQEIINARGNAQQQASLTYAKQLQGLTKDNDLINALIPVLGEAFKQTEKQLSNDELTSLLNLGKSNLMPLLEAYSGKGKMAEISLDKINIDQEDELFQALGLSEDELNKFAKAIEISTKDLKTQIRTQAKLNKEARQGRQANIFEQALQSGHGITQSFFETIKSLDTSRLNIVSDIVTEAAGQIGNETLSNLLDELPTMDMGSLEELQSFFKDFNLDNPIQALDQLNNKLQSVDKSSIFASVLKDVQKTNAALFDSGNLVQSFFLSDAYDSLSDSIDGFIKENGKITTDNIEELADSCSDLQKLLNNTSITAQGLAEALNLLENGTVPIDAITSALLEALSAGENFETVLSEVQKWIDEFDEGTDLKLGTDHIIDELDNLKEYVENWEFGNEPTENIWSHIFGKDGKNSYQNLLNQFGNDFAGLETYMKGEIDKISKWSENAGLGGIQEAYKKGITGLTQLDSEGLFFNWDLSSFDSTTQAINEVSNALGVGKEAAESFILSWQTHLPQLRTEWNELAYKTQLTSFAKNLQEGTAVTNAELTGLGAAIGKSADEVEADLNDVITKINETREAGSDPIEIPIVVNWQDENGANLSGDQLLTAFQKSANIPTIARYNGSELQSKADYSNFVKDFEHSFNNVVGPNGELQQGVNAIDFTALQSHLVDAFKLTPTQATEVANDIAKGVDGKFAQTIKVPIGLEDGSVQMLEKTITADSAEGLSANINAELEAADAAIVAQKLANLDVTSVGTKLSDALIAGGVAGTTSIQANIDGLDTNVTVFITYQETNSPPPLATGGTVTLHSTRATGGIIGSYAKGSENFHVQPGTALTGEEGPELIWNKNGGYAYITGQDGPEFQNLQPGDRIFNADETKKILHNSAATGGIIDSYASGGWKPSSDNNKGGGSGSGSSDKDEDNEWKNEIDWLYNVVQNIEELERQQNILQEEYNDLLTDQTKTGQDLYKMLIQQLGNLYAQLDHQTYALEKREQEMREFMDTTNDMDDYLWYNWNDRTIEIDWDKIDQITDEEQYNHIKELIDQAEDIQDKMDDAEDAIIDVNNAIQDLENIWRDTFVDFEDRVLKAVIKMYQTVIDNYSELNDTLNDSNSAILDAINKEISLQRQIRDNTKTEEEIANDEAQLAYLRRDTSGGNDLAALQLERELNDQRQNYEDNLVDQAVQRLQDDNDAAAAQREKQIEIMQAQLDYQSENGEFNEYIRELLTSAMGGDGELLTDSELASLLKTQENWDAMSAVSKEVWEEELNGTFKEVAAFLLKEQGEAEGTYFTAVTAAFQGVQDQFDKFYHGSYSQGTAHGGSSGGSSGGSGGSGGSKGNNDPPPSSLTLPQSTKDNLDFRYAIESGLYGSTSGSKTYNTVKNATAGFTLTAANSKNGESTYVNKSVGVAYDVKKKKVTKAATGGLFTTTGLMQIDGTAKAPEYVLNAKQTDAFLRLADVLPAAMSNTSSSVSNTFGATTNNIVINVDKIDSDYSVDQMVDRVKEKLFETGSYRNNNVLNFLR